MSAVLILEKYSEKCIVIRGDTKEYKDELKELGGKWNAGLKDGPGWIYPATLKEKVKKFVDKVNKDPKQKNSKEDKKSEPRKVKSDDTVVNIDMKKYSLGGNKLFDIIFCVDSLDLTKQLNYSFRETLNYDKI
jgi:hypothetical protein